MQKVILILQLFVLFIKGYFPIEKMPNQKLMIIIKVR